MCFIMILTWYVLFNKQRYSERTLLRRDALIEIRDDAIWILESCVLLIREDAIAILRYTIS